MWIDEHLPLTRVDGSLRRMTEVDERSCRGLTKVVESGQEDEV